ncbi:MAG: hypothetical protein JRN26_07635 [Nitrososphaerota archaeon]|jgi:IS5 family transposase|nr:hypothetical protein [Nitrososphaerota archaeon]MDG6927311.1 hypothetical protein [Nitrososphaerota archaeon]MDG6930331.1 hypothetical protein [Nitrososphaerota archaeon]MDG6931687.1 hypothetical protein [Nitrososphaerota archaeon]MDG6936735.1 hypothetical protein [Nitrososphaerota archaeon]
MIRASRNNPLTEEDKEVSRILSGIRAHVEDPYAMMKMIFNFTVMHATTIPRENVKAMFMYACFNLMRAAFLTNQLTNVSLGQFLW